MVMQRTTGTKLKEAAAGLWRAGWRSIGCLAASVMCLLPAASAQEAAPPPPTPSIQVFSFGGDGLANPGANIKMLAGAGGGMAIANSTILGVDPNNKSALFSLLNNESIRRELQLSDEQQQGAKKILDESARKLNDLVRSSIQQGMSLRDAGVAELMAANRQQAEAAIEEILLPDQLKRIRQLAYQVEVSRLGLGPALTSGRLGKEIGVNDNQKQNLSEKAATIEEEARVAIARIRAAAQAKLLSELSTEQRTTAEDLLGNYFLFEEPKFEQRLKQSLNDQSETKSR